MKPEIFSAEDRHQIADQGLTVEAVLKQLRLLRRQPPPLQLLRPCTPGDGIRRIEAREAGNLIAVYERAAQKRRCAKFVPASGAASRMFKTLLQYLEGAAGETGDPAPQDLEDSFPGLPATVRGLGKFAFYPELERALAAQGLSLPNLLAQGRFRPAIRCLLSAQGLDYARLPKALLAFHAYPEGGRTAFEEHLVEGAGYLPDAQRHCRLHFTVSAGHRGAFETCLRQIRPRLEEAYGLALEVAFSVQALSTDTLAADLQDRPFRTAGGRLLFRPGGHGALLGNLQDLQADIVFIKNIDNVSPDRLKPLTVRWKKTLGGLLISLQERLFACQAELERSRPDRARLEAAAEWAAAELGIRVPAAARRGSVAEFQQLLRQRLLRPLRVCGMVPRKGEPGGGPFWVRDPAAEPAVQIVESAQIDRDSAEQRAVWEAATHFNPVDLVCGLRDWRGRPFELQHHVDPDTYLLTRKSSEGRELKALEHPGLWNGSMARWLTVLVEVPAGTFNPVKTVNDLLAAGTSKLNSEFGGRKAEENSEFEMRNAKTGPVPGRGSGRTACWHLSAFGSKSKSGSKSKGRCTESGVPIPIPIPIAISRR